MKYIYSLVWLLVYSWSWFNTPKKWIGLGTRTDIVRLHHQNIKDNHLTALGLRRVLAERAKYQADRYFNTCVNLYCPIHISSKKSSTAGLGTRSNVSRPGELGELLPPASLLGSPSCYDMGPFKPSFVFWMPDSEIHINCQNCLRSGKRAKASAAVNCICACQWLVLLTTFLSSIAICNPVRMLKFSTYMSGTITVSVVPLRTYAEVFPQKNS